MSIDRQSQASKAYLEKLAGKLTLGRLIRAIRQGEELAQIEFADQLSISKQQLCDIEHDRKLISPKMAAQYADILGYPPEQFIRLSVQESLERAGLDMTVEIKPAHAKRRRLKLQFA